MIGSARFHRGSNAQRVVNAAKITIHMAVEVERQRRDMVLYFLLDSVVDPCETPQ
jgi:hypothetical protein